MALKLTPSGTDLLLRAIAGEVNIKFTAIQLGNGADAGKSAAALSNPLLTAEISSYEVGDIFVTLRTTFSNSQVSASFRATEVGVLAHDPDTADGTLLYAYQYTPEGESDYIPASTDKVLETQMDVLVYIGDAENVTASISQSLVYASRADLEAHVKNMDNPHKVTKEQVGLGNVPNAATNDLTPTYTKASALVEMKSGEKLSIAFGKLAKSVSSLIAHMKDGENPHKVTADQVGAAKSSHKHSTNDLTGGVLGVARGGTGVTGYDKLKEKLGVNCKIERVQPTKIYTDYDGGTEGENQNFDHIAYGNDTFVCIGDKESWNSRKVAYLSNNGVVYETIDIDCVSATDSLRGIVYGNGRFVAIFKSIDNPKVIYSEDGRNWNAVSFERSLEGAKICFGMNTFVILCGGIGENVCYTSKDAKTWTPHTMPSIGSNAVYEALCCGDGKFVAITRPRVFSGEVMFTTSNDKGESWSDLKQTGVINDAKDIIFAHGKYIIWNEGDGNTYRTTLAVSKDLVRWDALGIEDIGFSDIKNLGITNTGFCLFAYNSADPGYYSSDDGYTWRRSTEGRARGHVYFLHARGIAWAIEDGSVKASSDGDSWTEVFYKLSNGNVIAIGPMKGE